MKSTKWQIFMLLLLGLLYFLDSRSSSVTFQNLWKEKCSNQSNNYYYCACFEFQNFLSKVTLVYEGLLVWNNVHGGAELLCLTGLLSVGWNVFIFEEWKLVISQIVRCVLCTGRLMSFYKFSLHLNDLDPKLQGFAKWLILYLTT